MTRGMCPVLEDLSFLPGSGRHTATVDIDYGLDPAAAPPPARVHAAPRAPAIADDPRLAMALELRRQRPDASFKAIARELGVDANRVRAALLDAGLLKPRFAEDSEEAPDWYHRPCGRVQALRKAHGIKAP